VWREAFISGFPSQFAFFNPQLPPGSRWDDEAGKREADALATAPVILFVLTDETPSIGSLAEIGWVLLNSKITGQRVVVQIDSHPDERMEAFRAEARDLAKWFDAKVCETREAAFAATLEDLEAVGTATQSSDSGSPSSGGSVEYLADSLRAVLKAPGAALEAITANRSFELVVDWKSVSESLGQNPDDILADGAWRASRICANLAEKAGFKVVRRNFPS
jgi:hypothetical protein